MNMTRIKQQDGEWWVEDGKGLRRATSLEVELWQRLVLASDEFNTLKPVVERLVTENRAYQGSLIHLVGALVRARTSTISPADSNCRVVRAYLATAELNDAITASSQLITSFKARVLKP